MEAQVLGWQLSPAALTTPVLVGGLGAWATWQRQRLGKTRRTRWFALVIATALVALVFVSPLAALAHHDLLTADVLGVLVLVGVVPPLLVFATRSTSARHAHDGAPMRSWWWLAARHPITGLIALNTTLLFWQMKGPFEAGHGGSDVLFALDRATILAAAVAFWLPILGRHGSAPATEVGTIGRLAYILFATIPQTFVGVTIALAHRPIYSTYVHGAPSLGIATLTDQQVAGASLAIVSKIALLVAFGAIFLRLLADPGVDDSGGDDGGTNDRTPEPGPPGLRAPVQPAWLASLSAQRLPAEPAPRRQRRQRQPAKLR